MIYRCKNCGGNVLYDPASKQMKCPSCDSIESQEIVPSQEPMACPNCNSPIEYRNFGSAARCGACGTWVLNDVMVSPPHKINVSIPLRSRNIRQRISLRMNLDRSCFSRQTSCQPRHWSSLRDYTFRSGCMITIQQWITQVWEPGPDTGPAVITDTQRPPSSI